MIPKAVALAEEARLSQERGRRLEVALHELENAHDLLAERERDAQRRAKMSDEQFRSLVETMPQLAWVSGPDGGSRFRNKRWSEYTGLALDEIEAKGWETIVDAETAAAVINGWNETLRTKKPFETESKFRRADGELRWFLVRAVPLFDGVGSVTAWVGTATDIHDQRLIREQALRTARMKDEFLATVSHELRTPLNAILGWSRLLRGGALPSGTQVKALEAVERNAVAQVQLIDDLLDISRIISGKTRVDFELTNPAAAVEAAIDAIQPASIAKGVKIVSTVDHSRSVIADAARLQQIVWNLIGNAVKFTPEHGQVTVTLEPADSQIQIVVSDTGIGIGPEFLPHLFERFSQEDGSIRRAKGGLGIGLAITKHLVELHGGSIRAESRGEGQGTKIVVTLPLADAQAEAKRAKVVPRKRASRPEDNHPELNGVRLLLVEDDPDSSEVMLAVLADYGVRVTHAVSAERALERLTEQPFDVILSDIGLPGQDGYELMRAVRANPTFAAIPAAAVTAYAHVEDRRRALAAGYQMHIAKPVEPSELIAGLLGLAKMAAAISSA
jgi:PAS domain S-box-containing protein